MQGKMKIAAMLLITVNLVWWTGGASVSAADLSPDQAETIVRETILKEGPASLTNRYERYGTLYRIDPQAFPLTKYQELEKEGYIKILPDTTSSQASGAVYGIQFTEKAGPFITKTDVPSDDKVYIDLAKVDTVKIMALEKNQQNEYKADVSIGLRLTPFGEILLGRGVKIERNENVSFAPHDDGWRVKLKINF
jgi:hypothetical protein